MTHHLYELCRLFPMLISGFSKLSRSSFLAGRFVGQAILPMMLFPLARVGDGFLERFALVATAENMSTDEARTSMLICAVSKVQRVVGTVAPESVCRIHGESDLDLVKFGFLDRFGNAFTEANYQSLRRLLASANSYLQAHCKKTTKP